MRKRRTKKLANGHKTLKLENLKFPTFDEVMSDIRRKVGKRPKLPKGMPQGNWTKQSLKVLNERYLMKDENGEVVETPEDMCWRVAWEIASAECRWGKKRKEVVETAKQFYNLMVSREFLPNSPTLMNAGTGNMLQYSACFVLPVEDSMEGIFDAIKYQALIHKTGGGTGFAFSRLRPKGAMVKSSTGTASGPVSFMRIFDAATNEVKQGGKRRGANMGILRVDHPDVLEFIHCKEDGGVTNFNISVALTDEFMEAYKRDTNYNLVDPRNGQVVGSLNAREVFDEIADGAWRTGDPGLVFLDRRNRGSSNPVPSLGPIEATNPCGEQELYPFDACNLGSIFLTYFVKEKNGKKQVDWEKLKKVAAISTRFLDDVIEVNPYPLEEIRRTVLGIRRIGLGVGGWADMLIELGIPYDSEEALELGEKIMKTVQDEAVKVTKQLAQERGAFPLFPVSVYKDGKPRRNSTVTTIAPTGSISIIAGSSSGIEPLFAIAFRHIVKDKSLDRTLTFFNPTFEELAKKRSIWSNEIKDKVADHGVIRNIDEIPQDVRNIFGTAHEIHHNWHIRMQAAFQKYTENAVSKTINMENKVSKEDIKDAYLLAWETDCKGITVFRDGCKDTQVLNLGTKEKKEEEKEEKDWKRPLMVQGATYKIKTPVGTAFVTINGDKNGNPIEVFINIGRAGSDIQAMAEALGRLISKSLKFGSNLTAKERASVIVDQLKGIGGRRSVGFGPNRILSLPDAIAAAISWHLGFKVNGYGQIEPNGEVANHNHKETNGDHINNGSGVQLDSAGAVMTAQFPHLNGGTLPSGVDDHTAASAESNLAPDAISPGQLMLNTETLHVAGDICPSCGAGALVYEEGCSKCHVCGHSEC